MYPQTQSYTSSIIIVESSWKAGCLLLRYGYWDRGAVVHLPMGQLRLQDNGQVLGERPDPVTSCTRSTVFRRQMSQIPLLYSSLIMGRLAWLHGPDQACSSQWPLIRLESSAIRHNSSAAAHLRKSRCTLNEYSYRILHLV